MRTIEQVNQARGVICEKLKKHMSREQKIMLQGMLCALCYVAETPNGESLERLVAGQPMWQEAAANRLEK